jgi:hypothetical protein
MPIGFLICQDVPNHDKQFASDSHHILKAAALGDFDQRIGLTSIFIGDIFDEEQDEHIALIGTL